VQAGPCRSSVGTLDADFEHQTIGCEETSMLNGMKVAILVADGFEQVELAEPRKALDEAGAETLIGSPAKGQVQAWQHFDKADKCLCGCAARKSRCRIL
jgi:hypothetical protein